MPPKNFLPTTALLATCIISVSVVCAQDKSSTVTIPLETFTEYMKLKERPSVTAIDEVVLSGRLSGQKLSFRLSGRVSGKAQATRILDVSDQFRFRKCDGTAVLVRGTDAYSVYPDKDRFSLSCELIFESTESMDLSFAQSVLDVRVDIEDANVVEESGEEGAIEITLSKRTPRTAIVFTGGKPSVTPRYHLTVTSDQVRFQYQFDMENPNPESKEIHIPLLNGEMVGAVQTEVPNELKEKEILFRIRPGQSQALVNGQLPSNAFVPLLDTEEQYLLLEFHPLVALRLTSEPPRVSLEQTGLSPRYQAAMGFLIGKGKKLVWESKVREVFVSQSMAVESANYLLYLPERGFPIVDASWTIRNQGKNSLSFELPGKALFASADGVPQVLAKTDKNELFLPLRTGSTTLRIQYELPQRLPALLGLWRTRLVKPEAELPIADAEIRLTSRHKIVVGNFSSKTVFPFYDAFFLLWCLCLSCLWFFSLRHCSVRSRAQLWSSSVAVFFVPWFFESMTVVIPLGLALAFSLKYRQQLLSWMRTITMTRWMKAIFVAVGIMVLLVVFVWFAGSRSTSRYRQPSQESLSKYATQRALNVSEPEAVGEMKKQSPPTELEDKEEGEVEEIVDQETYLGLPVERVIPQAGKSLWFKETSLPADRILPIRLILVSFPAYLLLSLLAIGFGAFPLLQNRKILLDQWKGRPV